MNWFKIFLVLVSFLGNSCLLAMGEEESPCAASKLGTAPSLNFSETFLESLHPRFVDMAKEIPQGVLHFYWSVGRLPEMVPEDQRGRVGIGGKKYSDIFFNTVIKFLNFVPGNINIVMICDSWTYDTNKREFDALREHFKNRFSIHFVDDMVEALKKSYPAYKRILELVSQNACGGNPAIASDILRLLLPFFHHKAPKGSSLVYSDIDLFCHVFHTPQDKNKTKESELDIFLENLLSRERIGRLFGRNDFIKFNNTPEEAREVARILRGLSSKFDGRDTLVSHFPKLIDCLQRFEEKSNEERKEVHFQDYLSYAKARFSMFHVGDIVFETGPGLLLGEPFCYIIPPCLKEYGYVETFSWRDVRYAIRNWSFYKKFIPDGFIPNGFIPTTIKVQAEEEKAESLKDVLEEKFGQQLQEIGQKSSKEYLCFRSILSDLGFLNDFGEMRPFYQRLKVEVILNGTRYFNGLSPFAELVRLYYVFDNAQQTIMDKKSWARLIMHQIDSSNDAVPKVIQESLKMLGSDFTLSVEDIMDMVKDL